jgi:hypothetical protein
VEALVVLLAARPADDALASAVVWLQAEDR